MGSAASLQMSYEDMQTEIKNLTRYANDFEKATESMTTSVNTLCEGWISESTETYREDYTALANNFTQTLEVVRELIDSTSKYIADMQKVDSAYSKHKVQVG